VFAGGGGLDDDSAPALRLGANADNSHVLARQRLGQIAQHRNAQPARELLVEFPFPPPRGDIRLIGQSDKLAAAVGSQVRGVTGLMGMVAGHQQHSIGRPFGTPPRRRFVGHTFQRWTGRHGRNFADLVAQP
jgi:hypothetical protein